MSSHSYPVTNRAVKHAAGAGHHSVVRVTLDLREDLEASTRESKGALHAATEVDQISVMGLLLFMKADKNVQK